MRNSRRFEISQLSEEDRVGELARMLEARDPGETSHLDEKMREFKATLQKIEDSIEAPRLVLEAKQEIERTEQALEGATADDRKNFLLLKPELEAAMRGDIEALRPLVERMFQLRVRILERTPEWWIGYRDYLLERKSEMLDQTQARLWFSHADRAINAGDIEALKTACRQLWSLLPKQLQTRGYGGGTVRARGTNI